MVQKSVSQGKNVVAELICISPSAVGNVLSVKPAPRAALQRSFPHFTLCSIK